MTNLKATIEAAITDQGSNPAVLAQLAVDAIEGKQMTDETKAAYTAGQARVTVKPLVWEGSITKLENGCYYQAIQSRTGKTWCVSFVYRDGSHTLGYFPTEEAAKLAAFTHHEAAVRSALEVG